MTHAIKISSDADSAHAHKGRNARGMENSVLQAKSETTEVAGAFEPETSEKKFAAGGSGKPNNGFERSQGFIRSQGFVRNFISRKPASNSGGAEAGPQFQQMLSSSKGRGISLPSGVKREMETGFGTNLSSVRLHTDSNAIQMSREIKAQAFTHGQDIYFNRGKFDTQSTNGRGLLAHELTHTLQQRNVSPGVFQPLSMQVDGPDSPLEREANEGARRILSMSADPSSVRGAFRASPAQGNTLHALSDDEELPQDQISNWGTFKALQYHSLRQQNASGPEIGMEIHLEFYPGKNVDATKIGLTQIVDVDLNGKDMYNYDTPERKSGLMKIHSAKRGAGAGYHIDRDVDEPDPAYFLQNVGGIDQTKPVNTLEPEDVKEYDKRNEHDPNFASGISTIGMGGWGHRYMQSGKLSKQPASLADTPYIPSCGPNSHQLFETAAYAVEGIQQGTYYGSVTWGWKKDEKGEFSLLDFKLKSKGVPSADFLTAANIWNQSKTDWEYETNQDNIKAYLLQGGVPIEADESTQPNFPKGQKLFCDRNPKTIEGKRFVLVSLKGSIDGKKWMFLESDVTLVPCGKDTIDLPIPEVFLVSGADVKLSKSETPAPDDPLLPEGARVVIREDSKEGKEFVKVEVIETGLTGLVKMSSLKKEELGTL